MQENTSSVKNNTAKYLVNKKSNKYNTEQGIDSKFCTDFLRIRAAHTDIQLPM